MTSWRPAFVDRERELDELRRWVGEDQPSLILVYGRRRVGKTYLLTHAWPDLRSFYFLAADSTPHLNRHELLQDLSRWLDQPLEVEDYPTWRAVFRLFVQLAQQPLIVVLDEFQYLLGGEDDIVSQLVAVWDREARGVPLTLVLCGSEVGTLEHLQEGGRPLYGRPNRTLRLRPFDYWDAAQMSPGRDLRQAALFYGVFGGTPRYLAALREDDDLETATLREFLSTRGEVHLQVQHIIEQERGIRQPAEYRAVLAAIADGATVLNEITQTAGLGERVHVARRAVDVLEGLELIARGRNFASPPKAPYRYRISDHAVRFWYRFVHPNRGRLELGDEAEVWRSRVERFLDDYMGRVFEAICAEGFFRRHRSWGLPAAREWARWEGQDRNRRSIEIDVVARLDDGGLLVGEIKWSRRAMDRDQHLALLRDLQDLAASGQGWAKEALEHRPLLRFAYFSAAGFTDEFQSKEGDEDQIRLVALEDLYSEDV